MDYLSKHENLESVLDVDNSSLYELEQELKKFPRQEGEVQRLYSETVKLTNELITQLEIVTSQMVERIIERYEANGQKVSFSAKDIIRKNEVPLESEYQKVKRQLDDANTQKTYLLGLCKAMASKSHRLTELINLMLKYRHDELYIPKTNKRFEDLATIDGMDMEE